MSRLPIFGLACLWCALSVAEVVDQGDAVLDISAERARIQAEQASGESRFSEKAAACYAKFAVTDCLQEVRMQRRHLLDDLRRQTGVLNEMERRKKTLSKMGRMQLKPISPSTDLVNSSEKTKLPVD